MKSVGEQNVDKTQGLKKNIFVPDTADSLLLLCKLCETSPC